MLRIGDPLIASGLESVTRITLEQLQSAIDNVELAIACENKSFWNYHYTVLLHNIINTFCRRHVLSYDISSDTLRQLLSKIIDKGASVNQVLNGATALSLALTYVGKHKFNSRTLDLITEFLLFQPSTDLNLQIHKNAMNKAMLDTMIISRKLHLNNGEEILIKNLINAGADVNYQADNVTLLWLAVSHDKAINLSLFIEFLLRLSHINLHIKCGEKDPTSVLDLAITNQIDCDNKNKILQLHEKQITLNVQVIESERFNPTSRWNSMPRDILEYLLKPMLFGSAFRPESTNVVASSSVESAENKQSRFKCNVHKY